MEENRQSAGRVPLFAIILAALILVLRIWECYQPPERTGDVFRHLLTAVMVEKEGLGAVKQPLDSWSARAAEIAPWTAFPYNYPPLTLLFFQLVAALWPSVLMTKLLLTLVEAANAWLVFRLTSSRATALLYWGLPLSIWWVSREAQIEPLQNLFLLTAILGAMRRRPWTIAVWLLACQVKVSAIFAAPFFGLYWLVLPKREKAASAALAVVGLVPLAVATMYWPVVPQTLRTANWSVTLNIWHWRAVSNHTFGGWAPFSLLLWIRVAVAGLALLVLWFVRRRRLSSSAALSLMLFIAASATISVFQGWYFCAMVPFALLASDNRTRIALVCLLQLCEPLSVYQLLVRPVGWGRGSEHIGVYDDLRKTLPAPQK